MKKEKYTTKKELKEGLASGDLNKAMLCARNIGYFGVAAKIAEHIDSHYDAGCNYSKFGNSKKAFESYLKAGENNEFLSSNFGFIKAKKIAEEKRDANMVLEVEFREFFSNKSKDDNFANRWFWSGKYIDFSKDKYENYINFEEARERVEDSYCNELMNSMYDSKDDYDEAREIFLGKNQVDKALEVTDKQLERLKKRYSKVQKKIKTHEEKLNFARNLSLELEKNQDNLKDVRSKLENLIE